MVIPSASSPIVNPVAQPLNVADESRVANTTRNPTPDNVLVRSPEATDNTAERNNAQAATQPRDEFEQSDAARFQANSQNVQSEQPSIPEQPPIQPGDIVVTPGDDNVDSGDRSQNSIQVTVVGSDGDGAEITREGVFDAVALQQQQENAELFLEETFGTESDDNNVGSSFVDFIQDSATFIPNVETGEIPIPEQPLPEQPEAGIPSEPPTIQPIETPEVATAQVASNNDSFSNFTATFNAQGQATAEQQVGFNLDVTA